MEPIHFGPDSRLFGLRSEPSGAVRRTAIVICQTWGPEYMRCYRAMHLLAQQLAGRGFETLRFDYSSTGDSADHAGPASLDQWLTDIRAAVEELRELSGAPSICLLGLRLGALLANQAVAEGLAVDRLVLWDMPASGAAWIEELTALNHQHYERKNRYRPSWLWLRLPRDELLGAPWPASLQTAVAALAATPALPPERTLLLDSADLGRREAPGGRRVALPDAAHWTDITRLTTPWIPANTARVICDALESDLG